METTRSGIAGRVSLGRTLGAILLLVGAAEVRAEMPKDVEHQVREFQISLDGKTCGKCKMDIAQQDDGTHRMQISAVMRMNFGIFVYKYNSSGTEYWKDQRLVGLENVANFNGKRYQVQIAPARRGMALTINGKAEAISPDGWVSSYWHLPERIEQSATDSSRAVRPAAGVRHRPAEEARTLSLIDSDKGRQLRGTLEFVNTEAVPVAGKTVKCRHYRLSGDVQVDLWYDASRRLVRQLSADQGHKTLLELTSLTDE